MGWTDGRNVRRSNIRWAEAMTPRLRKYAAELVALAPDVILATRQRKCGTVDAATRTVPIVFMIVPDPVGAGYVDSLARPGGNATGLHLSNMVSAENGWSCSSRSRRA